MKRMRPYGRCVPPVCAVPEPRWHNSQDSITQVIARAGRCTLYWRTWLQSSLYSRTRSTPYSRDCVLRPMLIARIISDRNGLSVVCFEQNGWPRQPGSRGAHALMCVSVRLHHVCPRPCHPYDYMSALFSALLAGASRSR